MAHASFQIEEDERWSHYLPCRPVSMNNDSHFFSTETDEQLRREAAVCTTLHKMTVKNNLLL
jgi:hypothetical protein